MDASKTCNFIDLHKFVLESDTDIFDLDYKKLCIKTLLNNCIAAEGKDSDYISVDNQNNVKSIFLNIIFGENEYSNCEKIREEISQLICDSKELNHNDELIKNDIASRCKGDPELFGKLPVFIQDYFLTSKEVSKSLKITILHKLLDEVRNQDCNDDKKTFINGRVLEYFKKTDDDEKEEFFRYLLNKFINPKSTNSQ